MVAQVLVVLLTVVSYIMTRKLKDNGGVHVKSELGNLGFKKSSFGLENN